MTITRRRFLASLAGIAAVGGNRGSHGPESARATGSPLALPDEVELVLRHPPDHTQGV